MNRSLAQALSSMRPHPVGRRPYQAYCHLYLRGQPCRDDCRREHYSYHDGWRPEANGDLVLYPTSISVASAVIPRQRGPLPELTQYHIEHICRSYFRDGRCGERRCGKTHVRDQGPWVTSDDRQFIVRQYAAGRGLPYQLADPPHRAGPTGTQQGGASGSAGPGGRRPVGPSSASRLRNLR